MQGRTKLIRARLCEALHNWRDDIKAVAAVEFALLLPVMLIMFAGCVELTQGIIANRKMAKVAGYVGDMVSQVSAVTTSDLQGLAKIGDTVMLPFGTGDLGIRVVAYSIDDNGGVTRDWHWKTGVVKKGIPALPSGLQINNTSIIGAQAEFVYKPAIAGSFGLEDSISMSKVYFYYPRAGGCVSLDGGDCGA